MRAVFGTAALLAGVLIGYSASGMSAQGQNSGPAAVAVGDVIVITYPSEVTGATLRCTVTGVDDGYVRCRDDSTNSFQKRPEVWHNLRIAWQIAKQPPDEFSVR